MQILGFMCMIDRKYCLLFYKGVYLAHKFVLGVTEMEKETIDYEALGKQMRRIRTEAGKKQEEVAAIFPISRTVYTKYETGKVRPSREYISIFANYFHIRIEELLKKVSVAIPDTCALLKNKRLLHMLLEDYEQVIIPSTVLNELSYQKNHGKNKKEKNIAWQIMTSINYYVTEYKERFKKMDSEGYKVEKSVCNIENDLKIIALAKDLSKKTIGNVEIITNDIDISSRYEYAIKIDDYIAKRTKTFGFSTILDLDKEYEHLESYQKIIDKLDLNLYLPDGMTLLISCITYNHKEEIKQRGKSSISKEKIHKKMRFLLDHGADPNKNDNGRYCLPPLAHCIQVNDFKAFCILLEYKCDYNKASRDERISSYMKIGKLNEGNTPLMVACWHGQKKYVEKLCKLPEISLNQQDSNGYTALIKCVVQRYKRKIKGKKYKTYEDLYYYLLKKGADPLIRDRNNQTIQDWWKKADKLEAAE